MKQLTICALLLGSFFFCTAQNGGISEQNSSIKIQYLGNNQVQITNLKSYDIVVRVNDSKTEGNYPIPGNGSYTYTIPASLKGTFIFKAKNTTSYPHADNGWLELAMCITPVEFFGVNSQHIEGRNYWVNWQVGNASNVSHYNIKVSTDGGKTWKLVQVLLGDDQTTKYQTKITLNNSKN